MKIGAVKKLMLAAALAASATALVACSALARPQATPEGIVFTFEAPGASRVTVAGEFNTWAPAKNTPAS